VLLIAVPGAVVQHVYGIACFVQSRLGVSTFALFGVKSVVNLALSVTLLPIMGVVGSAIGAAVSYLVLQWLFLLDQSRHLGVRLGTGALVLLAAHGAAVAMALISGTITRLAFATVAGLLLLAWARWVGLFSKGEVAAMVPARFEWIKNPLLSLVCRKD
jgi:hypothetical protein